MMDAIVELASSLVHCETTRDRPDEMWRSAHLVRLWWQDSLDAELARSTMTVWGEEGKDLPLILLHPPNDLRPEVLLHGHLDVVGAPADQFRPHQQGERLYGRGSADMKGAAAVLIHLAAQRLAHHNGFGVLLTFNEEVGGRIGTGRGTESHFQETAAGCRFFLSGERSNLRIAYRSKGVMRLRVTQPGKNAHAATPWEGDNALWGLVNGLAGLSDRNSPEGATLTLTSIETDGDAFNMVPGQASAGFDVRFTTPEERAEILDQIDRALPQGEVEVLLDEPGASCDEDHPDLKRLCQVLTDTGREPVLYTKPHASDVRLANAAGTPGVVFGPDGANVHGENEWVSIPSLQTYHEILDGFITLL